MNSLSGVHWNPNTVRQSSHRALPQNRLLKYLLKENFHLVYREGGVRLSFNFYNTLDEVDVLIDKLRRFKGAVELIVGFCVCPSNRGYVSDR